MLTKKRALHRKEEHAKKNKCTFQTECACYYNKLVLRLRPGLIDPSDYDFMS